MEEMERMEDGGTIDTNHERQPLRSTVCDLGKEKIENHAHNRSPKGRQAKPIQPFVSVKTRRAFACGRLQCNAPGTSPSFPPEGFVLHWLSVVSSPTATSANWQQRKGRDPRVVPYAHVQVTRTHSPPSTPTTNKRSEKGEFLRTQQPVLLGSRASVVHSGVVETFLGSRSCHSARKLSLFHLLLTIHSIFLGMLSYAYANVSHLPIPCGAPTQGVCEANGIIRTLS